MNLIRTPSNADADALREEHPHLDSGSIRVSVDNNGTNGNKKGPGAGKGAGAKKGGRNAAKNAGMVESKRSAPSSLGASNKAKAAAAAAAATAAEAATREEKKSTAGKDDDKPKQRVARSPVGSEDEDESDDDGLLIEYPDPQPTAASSYARVPAHHPQPHSSQPPPAIRRFSDFMEHAGDDESDEDADAEYDEDDLLHEDEAGDNNTDDGFKLPSPVGRNGQGLNGDAGGDAPGEDDLPAEDELMAMLEEEIDEGGSGGGANGEMDVDSESSVSEED